MRDVHIFDADSPPALACVRSLGRDGVKVHVHSPNRVTVCGASRYVAERHLCPSPDEPQAFLQYLEQEFCSGRIQAVLPTSDTIAFVLAELDAVLPDAQRRVLPKPEAVRTSLFKHEFDRRLESLGFATPRAVYPPTDADDFSPVVASQDKQMTFPLVLKPRSHIGVPNERGEVVQNPAELSARFRRYEGPATQPFWLSRYPELAWPLVQEYVPGALENLYSISGFIDEHGCVRAVSASHKVMQWPPKLGVGTLFEVFKDRAIIERGLQLVKAVLGRGLFELELIFDGRRNEWLAIDLNPRAFGQMSLDIARGANLPLLWWEALLGRDSAKVDLRDAVWLHSIPYHLGSTISVLKGPGRVERLLHYARVLTSNPTDIVWDWRDPGPSSVFAARMLRHPGGLVRPLWREL